MACRRAGREPTARSCRKAPLRTEKRDSPKKGGKKMVPLPNHFVVFRGKIQRRDKKETGLRRLETTQAFVHRMETVELSSTLGTKKKAERRDLECNDPLSFRKQTLGEKKRD